MSMNDKAYIQQAASMVNSVIPDDHSFILMVAPNELQGDARISYVSTMTRESAMSVMKEFLLTACDDDSTWLKHLEP